MKNQDQIEEISFELARALVAAEFAAMNLVGISAEYGPVSERILQAVVILEEVLDELDQ